MRMIVRLTVSTLLAFTALGGVLVAAASARTDTPSYALVTVGKFGGEPTIASSPTGVLYDTTPKRGDDPLPVQQPRQVLDEDDHG